MRRREFTTLLGGAAITWPFAASAQQPALPVIGLLNPASASAFADHVRGFRDGLKEAGYVEGENVTIVYGWAEGKYDRLPELAAAMVRRKVAAIAAVGAFVFAAKAATTTIPIVFVVNQDPVALGLVASLSRPGGNLTGINFLTGEVAAKRLQFLRELVPGTARVAVLVNPDSAVAESAVKDVEAAARTMGLQFQVLNASTSHEIDAAFATLARERPDGLFVTADLFFGSRRVQLVNLAARHAIPATYALRDYATVGGLMSYGTNLIDAHREVGQYVGRILNGAKPADLPVIQSTKFELVINAQTARMLGLNIPSTLLSTADEVIE